MHVGCVRDYVRGGKYVGYCGSSLVLFVYLLVIFVGDEKIGSTSFESFGLI